MATSSSPSRRGRRGRSVLAPEPQQASGCARGTRSTSGSGRAARAGRRDPQPASAKPDWSPQNGVAFSLALLDERAKWLEAHLPTVPVAVERSKDLNLGYWLLVEQTVAAAREAQDLSAGQHTPGGSRRVDAWIAQRRYEQLRAICDLVQLNLIAMNLRELEHIDAPRSELLLAADAVVDRAFRNAGATPATTKRDEQ